MSIEKVLITGVYGLIGGEIYLALQAQPEHYQVYGLARRRYPSERSSMSRNLDIPDERFILSDISDLDVLVDAMRDIDAVVHMAADPRADAPWESVLHSNIVGTRNVFEAARICGVERVVYASSIMVSWGYFADEPYTSIFDGRYDALTPTDIPLVTHEMPTRPTALYPASKVWGEAMGRVYADTHRLSVICLRIGWVNDEDYPHTYGWARAGWCSKRDIVQLTQRAIEAPADVRFDIFYGLSDNTWNWADIEHAKDVIGYAPQDNADEWLESLKGRR